MIVIINYAEFYHIPMIQRDIESGHDLIETSRNRSEDNTIKSVVLWAHVHPHTFNFVFFASRKAGR